METVFYPIRCVLGVPFFSKGDPFWVRMKLGWAKSAEQCEKQALCACFGLFERLETELPLKMGCKN